MRCHYCGAEMAADRDFCLCCGTRREVVPPVFPERISVSEPPVFPESIPASAPAADFWAAPEAPKDEAELEFPRIEPSPELKESWKEQVAAREPRIRAEEWDYTPGQSDNQSGVSRLQLPDRRGLGKMFFLGILTLGIYPVVIWSRMVTELNILASRHDGRRTMPYFAMATLAPVTLGIYVFVWMHKFCNRIEGELLRRDLGYRFGAKDFWLWNILGSLILVGPFVFVHKLTKAMNQLNADFNKNG